MYIRQAFSIFLIFTGSILVGQTFDAKYFSNSKWFSNNSDSTFYKADTIILVQYKNSGPAGFATENAESETKYLGHGDYVKLSFGKRHKMQLSDRVNNYISIVRSGSWSWSFDKKENVLSIYLNKTLQFRYKPISQREIKIASCFSQSEMLTTTELKMVRVK